MCKIKGLWIHIAALLPVLASLALVSCITTTSDMATIQADINNLKQDSYQGKKSLKDTEGKLSEMQKKLDEFKSSAEGMPKAEAISAIRNSQTSLYSQVSELLKEVQTLRGKFDENMYSVDKQLKQTSAEIELIKSASGGPSAPSSTSDIEQLRARLSSIETDLALIKGKVAAMELGGKVLPSQDPQALYDDAYNTFNQKQYADARKKWQAFLKANPEHKLAGNAQFWIGETYFAENNFADAILSYEEVLEKHKDNNKVPATMLKQAYAFLELGDKKAARGLLKSLIEKYPNSDVSEPARKKLDSIK